MKVLNKVTHCLVLGNLLLSENALVHAKSLKSYPTLCNPMDHSSVHGILQAGILEWFAIPSSRGSSQLRDRTHVSYVCLHWQVGSLPLAPLEKP